MGDRLCPDCGRAARSDAGYCYNCGVPLGSDLEVWDREPVRAETERRPGGVRRFLVPVAMAVAGLSLLSVLLIPGDGEQDGGVGDPVDESASSGPAPAVDGSASTGPGPQSVGRPDGPSTGFSTPARAAEVPVDLGDAGRLPSTDASHLAVTTGLDIEFIDLATGERTVQAVGGVDVWNSIYPVDDGVVISKSGFDRPLYVPLVGDVINLTEPGSDHRSWPIGVAGETVFLQGELLIDGTWHSTITAVTLDGQELWQRLLPFGLEAVGATGRGDVIINAGGRVFSISEGGTEAIGVGVVEAVIGDLVFIDRCGEDLVCGLEALDVSDGSVAAVVLDRRGSLEHRGGSPSFIVWSQNGGPKVYAVIDGEVIALDTAPNMSNGELGLAVDPTGVVAVAHYRRVTLTEPSGAAVDLTVDDGQCCGNGVAIAFLGVGT